jgi:hypothetical protein
LLIQGVVVVISFACLEEYLLVAVLAVVWMRLLILANISLPAKVSLVYQFDHHIHFI